MDWKKAAQFWNAIVNGNARTLTDYEGLDCLPLGVTSIMPTKDQFHAVAHYLRKVSDALLEAPDLHMNKEEAPGE